MNKHDFSFPNFRILGISEKDIVWKDTFVSFGVSDMRGIKDNIVVKWNKNEFMLEPGIETNDIFASGASVKIPIKNKNLH